MGVFVGVVESQIKKVAVFDIFVKHSGDVLFGRTDSDFETGVIAVLHDGFNN